MTKYNIGDKIKVRPNIKMLGILQLSEHAIYEVLNVGRAQNPENDQLYIRNEHGRVTPYLARLFMRAPSEGGQLMANIGQDGALLQLILAFPKHEVANNPFGDAMWGMALYDREDFHTIGELSPHFSRNVFQPVEM